MNKFTTIVCLFLLVLFVGCKKDNLFENYTDYVRVRVEPATMTFQNSEGFNYELAGTIISPKRVKMRDHGFLVYDQGGNEYPVIMGENSTTGRVTTNLFIESVQPLDIVDVIFYIVLETGDTINNYGVIYLNPQFDNGEKPSFAWTIPNVTDPADGNMNFDIIANNPDTLRYIISYVGVEYNDVPSYNAAPGLAFNGDNLNFYIDDFPISNQPQEHLYITLFGGSDIFTGTNYKAKFYAIYFDTFYGQEVFIESSTVNFVGPNLP